jgi:hypothetical protein
MRGLKNLNTSVLPGYQMYHNYFRPHEGIRNVTSAEKCGIKIGGDNKWITVIQNAKRDEKILSRPSLLAASISWCRLLMLTGLK